MTRRDFLATTAMAGLMGRAAWANEEETFEVTRSDDEWKAMLSPLEYKVMRAKRAPSGRSPHHWIKTMPLECIIAAAAIWGFIALSINLTAALAGRVSGRHKRTRLKPALTASFS